MQMMRSRLVAGAAIGLLAVTPAVGSAQDDLATREAAYFTAVMGMPEGFPEPQMVDADPAVAPDGGSDSVGALVTGITLESTDPRMTGIMDMAISSAQRNVGDEGFVGAETILYRVQTDQGSWVGPGVSFIAIADGPKGKQMGSLVGEGAYDGLNAIIYTDTGETLEGIIYAGDVPPASDFDGSADARAALEAGTAEE